MEAVGATPRVKTPTPTRPHHNIIKKSFLSPSRTVASPNAASTQWAQIRFFGGINQIYKIQFIGIL
jgi:hypothetical protein